MDWDKVFKPEKIGGKVANIAGRATAAALTGGTSELAYNGAKLAHSLKGKMGNKVKSLRTARYMLASDLQAMREPGQLGLTDSEIKQRTRDAQTQAVAAANAQSQQMAQAALAGQGFQQGALRETARDTQQAGEQAAAQASAAAHDASRQIQDREMARIRNDLNEQTERAREQRDKALKATAAALPAIMKGIASAAGGDMAGAGASFAEALQSGAGAYAGVEAPAAPGAPAAPAAPAAPVPAIPGGA